MERKPAILAELVGEFVKVSHGDLARVKELVEQEPGLVNASWDWGGGDWETALGAASHTGQVAIAEFLLANGARMDIFCATMLGKDELLHAFLEDDPTLAQSKGPHGIPLVDHAAVGLQTAAVEIIEKYLFKLG